MSSATAVGRSPQENGRPPPAPAHAETAVTQYGVRRQVAVTVEGAGNRPVLARRSAIASASRTDRRICIRQIHARDAGARAPIGPRDRRRSRRARISPTSM